MISPCLYKKIIVPLNKQYILAFNKGIIQARINVKQKRFCISFQRKAM